MTVEVVGYSLGASQGSLFTYILQLRGLPIWMFLCYHVEVSTLFTMERERIGVEVG